MSFLKSLIQRLLDSRTTPAEAAHYSAPGRSDIELSGLTEYVCPADGYIAAMSNALNPGGFNLQLLRNGLRVAGGPQEVSDPVNWYQAVMIPVAKGDKVTLQLFNQNVWNWRFISSIGGV